MTATEQRREHGERAEPFERAKLPMVLAAVGIVAGLAIAGSLNRTPARAGDPAPSVPFGGAVVLAGWVVGVAALHRLGRAGSSDRAPGGSATVSRATAKEEQEEDDLDAEPEPQPQPEHKSASDSEPDADDEAPKP